MKLLLMLFLICVIYLSSSARGQLPEDARNYHLMWMDSQLRGSWGGSQCVHDLLNCYEMVKGDIICSYGRYYSSICGVVKETCSDDEGYKNVGNSFEVKESVCRRMLEASIRTDD